MGLQGRFAETVRRVGATAMQPTLEAVAAELVARWSEPHRHYHNLAHLTLCLDEVDSEPVVALAAWGHDVVYDPRSSANEERSAQLLAGLLLRCQVPPAISSEACRLVRLTAGHRVEVGDRFGAMLADVDLAILARPWPEYLSYVDAVRMEYSHVPDELWRAGRGAVLSDLLDLPSMFHLHPEREDPARANLSRELARLTSH